jgi:hypothetical protein
MAIQYTDPTAVTPPTKIATDVFNPVNVDPFLKPDKTLASLEAKLRKATGDEAAKIQAQIDARQAELTAEYGSVGFGSGGYVLPNYAYSEASGAEYGDLLAKQTAVQAALAGKKQLIPSSTYYTDPVSGQTINLSPIYQAQYYGPQGQTGWMKDPVTGEIYDPMDPVRMNKAIYASIDGTADPKSLRKTFYDETGKELTAEQVAKTAQGLGFASKGWDIGFGAGMIAPGVSAKNLSDDQRRDLFVNNLVLSGEMPVAGYDPVTGRVTATNSSGTGDSTTVLGTPEIGGGSGGATAFDVFKNTLSLFFGPSEMNKPWVSQIYKRVSGFTKSGSTPEEAFNMAVLESYNDPALADFTKRFKGIFALQKMKQDGKAVTVPTVAEYFKTETAMGDILKSSNLGDLANEDFLGDVLGKGVSATEFGNRITAIFDRIDTAPDTIKSTIGRFFPTLDRVQLAKALALGEKGAKKLEQELAGYEVLSAAEQQGLGVSPTLPGGITNERAQQIAMGGGTFASTLPQFGQIAGARQTEQKLAEISGLKSMGVSGLTSAVIDKSAAELKKLEDLTRQEEARFAAKAGTIGSKSLASQSRANRVI